MARHLPILLYLYSCALLSSPFAASATDSTADAASGAVVPPRPGGAQTPQNMTSAHCEEIVCPSIAECENPTRDVGECCPVCLDPKQPEMCAYKNLRIMEGETLQPEADSRLSLTPDNPFCTTCACNDGMWFCSNVISMCPPLDCDESEAVDVPNECCRKCPDEQPDTAPGCNHPEGEFFPLVLPDYGEVPCTYCFCNNSQMYCLKPVCTPYEDLPLCPEGQTLEPSLCCPTCNFDSRRRRHASARARRSSPFEKAFMKMASSSSSSSSTSTSLKTHKSTGAEVQDTPQQLTQSSLSTTVPPSVPCSRTDSQNKFEVYLRLNASEDSVVLVNSKRNSAFYLSWVYWENLSFRVYAGPNTAHTFYAEDMLTGYDFKGLTTLRKMALLENIESLKLSNGCNKYCSELVMDILKPTKPNCI